jgi:glucarate dehydratase
MKISAVRATAVNIPLRSPARMSAGANDYSTRTIIEVETDSGISGLGEASYAFAADIIVREFAPALIGLDPCDAAALRRHCLPDTLDYGTPLLKVRLAAWGGLDLALWDILGKVAGLPVYQILGGTVRERAPFTAYAYSPPDAETAPIVMAAIARDAVISTGASIFEFKLGVHGTGVDIETVIAVHEALDGMADIAVDANMGMTYADARWLLREVAPMLENIEEPVASLDQMERLASDFNVNVSSHCTDVGTLLRYPHIDVVPTLDACGGITGVRRLAQVLGGLGHQVWLRSHAEAGIGWAAITHLGMSTLELVRPAQSLIDLIADDLIVGETWFVRDGGVRAPVTPGLGVSIDRKALDECHIRFQQLGEFPAFPAPLRRGHPSRGRKDIDPGRSSD